MTAGKGKGKGKGPRTSRGPYADRDDAPRGPVTIEERISWKHLEVCRFMRLRDENPTDMVYRYTVTRVQDELETLKALRDGRARRRH